MSQSVIFFFFFSFSRFFRVDRERGGWWMSEKGRKGVAKKRTHERNRERRGEKGKRVDRRREKREFRKPRATPFSEGRATSCATSAYPFRILSVCGSIQPFLRPPSIYNSPAMRRSRTKDEGKIPRWHRVPEESLARANCYAKSRTRCEIEQPWLSSLPFLSFPSLFFPFSSTTVCTPSSIFLRN